MNIGDSGERSQDFDLNLAPIIDCFTVLITFMLASASFLAISILDTNAAAPDGQTNPNDKPPSVSLEVELTSKQEIQFKVTGKTKLEEKYPALAGDYDREKLVAAVDRIVKQYPDTKTLSLSAGDDVEYRHVIRVMDILKTHVPSTLLGGF